MTLIIISFFAWILTILAPCVLPLLPVILGASAGAGENKSKPYIIIASLSVSIIIFTMLVQATTLLSWIDTKNLTKFSGLIIIFFWIISIFPNLWKQITTKLWLSDGSNKLLWKASQKDGKAGSIFMGMALGPVFTSCSPTYGIILSIIIAWDYASGLINLTSYTLWLAVILLAIALLWQKFVNKLKFVSDPNGKFKKILWVIFLIVWIAIITGLDKQLEIYLISELGWFGALDFEQWIIDRSGVKD